MGFGAGTTRPLIHFNVEDLDSPSLIKEANIFQTVN